MKRGASLSPLWLWRAGRRLVTWLLLARLVAMSPSLFTQQTFAVHLLSAEPESDHALNQRR